MGHLRGIIAECKIHHYKLALDIYRMDFNHFKYTVREIKGTGCTWWIFQPFYKGS